MKKLIILSVIGGMFVFVSVQSALTNNNKVIYNAKHQVKDLGKLEEPKVKKEQSTTEETKKYKETENLLSD